MAHRPIDTLWNWGDPEVSEAKFRELASTIDKANEPDYYFEVMTQIARTFSLRMMFEQAHKTLDSVDQYLSTYPNDLVKTRSLLERGRTYNSSGDKPKAIEQFLQAVKCAEQAKNDYYAIDALHMLGIADEPKKALEWNEKAMKAAEASSDERAKGWLGPLYNNTGWTYYDMGEYEKALSLFERDVIYRTNRKREGESRIARYSVGKTLRALKKLDESLRIQREIEKEIIDAKSAPDGYVFEEIAECLLEMQKENESKEYFKKAYDLLSKDQWLRANEKARLERLQERSN